MDRKEACGASLLSPNCCGQQTKPVSKAGRVRCLSSCGPPCREGEGPLEGHGRRKDGKRRRTRTAYAGWVDDLSSCPSSSQRNATQRNHRTALRITGDRSRTLSYPKPPMCRRSFDYTLLIAIAKKMPSIMRTWYGRHIPKEMPLVFRILWSYRSWKKEMHFGSYR